MDNTLVAAALPTGPFTILEPRDQGIGEFYEVQERRATDFEALKFFFNDNIYLTSCSIKSALQGMKI